VVCGADDLVTNLIPSPKQYEGWCFGTNTEEVCLTMPGMKSRPVELPPLSLRALSTPDRYSSSQDTGDLLN